MTIPLIGTVVIQFDGSSLKCESPGKNGMRQKVEGISFSDLPPEIQHTLLAQIESARDHNRNELMAQQRQSVQYVSETLRDVALAKRVWGNDYVESRTLRARLAKAGQYDPISGKIKTENTKQKQAHDPRGVAPMLDIEF